MIQEEHMYFLSQQSRKRERLQVYTNEQLAKQLVKAVFLRLESQNLLSSATEMMLALKRLYDRKYMMILSYPSEMRSGFAPSLHQAEDMFYMDLRLALKAQFKCSVVFISELAYEAFLSLYAGLESFEFDISKSLEVLQTCISSARAQTALGSGEAGKEFDMYGKHYLAHFRPALPLTRVDGNIRTNPTLPFSVDLRRFVPCSTLQDFSTMSLENNFGIRQLEHLGTKSSFLAIFSFLHKMVDMAIVDRDSKAIYLVDSTVTKYTSSLRSKARNLLDLALESKTRFPGFHIYPLIITALKWPLGTIVPDTGSDNQIFTCSLEDFSGNEPFAVAFLEAVKPVVQQPIESNIAEHQGGA